MDVRTDIIEKVIEKNRLKKEELAQIRSSISVFMNRLESSLKTHRIKARPMLGGSAAKGTLVKGDFDCDIFVRFDYSYRDKDISGLLETALSGFKDVQRVHGSRDYFQIEDGDISYELVPVLYITRSKDAQNVTDMSPLHVEWINARLSKNPGLRGEIIAAKVFCKAQDVYGAESHIGGFSGHVLDILVVYYGSFMKLLENAKRWSMYKVIDIENYNNVDEMNKSKISPLIIIDPVDKSRNASAALTREKFMLFKKRAADFLKKPSIDFFIKKQPTVAELRQMAGKDKIVLIRAEPLDGKDDIVGCKLLKAYTYIRKQLLLEDFSIIDSGWQWQKGKKAIFWYILPDRLLDEEKIHDGPPLNAGEDAKRFREKYKGSFVAKGRLYVKLKRRFRNPAGLVGHLLKGQYIAGKTGSARIIR